MDAPKLPLSREGSRPVWSLRVAGLACLFAFTGCPTAPPPAGSGCEAGTLKTCTCENGSSSTKECSDGAYGECNCPAPEADAAGDSVQSGDGTSADGAQPEVAQPDTAQPDSSEPDAGVADSGGGACQSDKDCKELGKVCDPLTKVCVACLTDAECAPSQHCVAYSCQGYTGCANSLGCKAAKGPDGKDQPICDQGIGECSACLSAADCPASHDCKAKQCIPFKSCQNSTDCSKDEVCNKSINRCVQCLGDNDCSANQLCEAGQCNSFIPCSSDKQCTDKGLLCDQTKGKCAQCLQNSDCPAIYNCQGVGVAKSGKCVLDICAQGQGACATNQKVTCNQVGDGYGSPQPCPGQSTCVAPGGKPECKVWVCTPGASCQGEKAVECSADGLEVLKSTDCTASAQKCFGGACKTQICSPGQSFCDANAVKLCDSDGLSGSVQKTCSSSEFCDTGACKSQICAPNQPACDGNSASQCNPNGSGYLSGGSECGKDKCIAGQCKPVVCEPSAAFCDGQIAKECDATGVSSSTVKTCGLSEFCETGICKAQICAPNQPVCDGNSAKICNALGSGYSDAGKECGTAAKCVTGVCKTKVCAPATQFCEVGKLKTCSPDGMSVSAEQACGSGNYCGLNKLGDAACLPWACEPAKATCNGPVATNCKADGSGYEDAGTECKVQGKVCSQGLCKSLLCDPLAPNYCDLNTAMKCDATGLNPTTVQACGAGTYCDKGVCQKQLCEPGKPGCFGAIAATCNAQGSGWAEGGTDCNAAGKTCGAGVCVAQTCGNGVVEGTEECDAGEVTTLNCTPNCHSLVAGLSFTGGHAVLANTKGFAPGPKFSVAAWIFAANGSGDWRHVLSNGQSGAYCPSVHLTARSFAGAAVSFNASSGTGNNYCDKQLFYGSGAFEVPVAAESSGQFKFGEWHHVVAVANSGTLSFYVDGKLTTALNANVITPYAAIHDFWLGREEGTPLAAGVRLRNLSIWTKALSQEDALTLSGKPNALLADQSGLYGSWTLTEASGTVGADTGPQAHHAQLKGATWNSDPAVCTPNAATCLGNLAGTCNAQGTGLVSASDCKAAGKTCGSGQCASTFTSCKAALSANPTAVDGLYPIDPDGSGPIAAANLFCDMKNGGLTLVANIYDSAGDDAPNETAYVVSGWQQTGGAGWQTSAAKVDRDVSGTGSAAVSMAFVAALKASAGQQNLKMCFVHQNGADTTCRNSADASLTLVSYATGNPKLTVYAADKLTYTFGRLAGLPGSVDAFAGLQETGFCVPRAPGSVADFGPSAAGLCESSIEPATWAGWGYGINYLPKRISDDELRGYQVFNGTLKSNPNPDTYGFRLYIGP